MRFTVTWLPTAERFLAQIWSDAPDRQSVTHASDSIDRRLANDPLKAVTPVDGLYTLRIDPLIVLCEISVDDRMVRVIELRYVGG